MRKLNFSVVVKLLFVLILTTFLVACEELDTDNQKPLIRLIEPAEDELVNPGDPIHLRVEFSDNVALASYKVNIHGAFDNHSHNSVNAAAVTGISTRAASDSVAFEKTWRESDFIVLGESPIAGKKQATVEHQHIIIPSKISRMVNGVIEEMPLREGHYHFIVYCTDEAGQESFLSKEIFISYEGDGHVH